MLGFGWQFLFCQKRPWRTSGLFLGCVFGAGSFILIRSQGGRQRPPPRDDDQLGSAMSLHISIGSVFQVLGWAYNKLSQRLMLSTYRWSHERWARRHQLGAHWMTLGDHIEYSVRIATLADPEPRISRIAFRATEQELEKVELVFEAVGGGIRYQEPISLGNLNRQPIVWTLDNIPYADLAGTSDRGLFFSIESFRILNCKLHLRDGQKLEIATSLTVSLMQNWLLNDEWVWRWRQRWNCNSIRWAKQGLREYWRFGFGRPRVIIFSPLPSRSWRKPVWGTVAQSIGWVMGCRWLVTIQFWLAIWSRLFVLNEDERLQWRWAARRECERHSPLAD